MKKLLVLVMLASLVAFASPAWSAMIGEYGGGGNAPLIVIPGEDQPQQCPICGNPDSRICAHHSLPFPFRPQSGNK